MMSLHNKISKQNELDRECVNFSFSVYFIS